MYTHVCTKLLILKLSVIYKVTNYLSGEMPQLVMNMINGKTNKAKLHFLHNLKQLLLYHSS